MNRNELPDLVKHYADRLSGDHADDAWHWLVDRAQLRDALGTLTTEEAPVG